MGFEEAVGHQIFRGHGLRLLLARANSTSKHTKQCTPGPEVSLCFVAGVPDLFNCAFTATQCRLGLEQQHEHPAFARQSFYNRGCYLPFSATPVHVSILRSYRRPDDGQPTADTADTEDAPATRDGEQTNEGDSSAPDCLWSMIFVNNLIA
jgi:hypothetical protein